MAVPADEAEKETRRKKFREAFPESSKLLDEGVEPPLSETKVNRMVGPLRRSRPELYEALQEYEKATGKKKTLIVSEALHHYLLERKYVQSNLSLADLYEAWCFLADLQEHAVRNFLRLGTLMFSEEYQSMLELARYVKGGEEAPAPIAKPLPPEAKDITTKIVDKIWKFAEPMLDWALEQAFRNMAKFMGAKAPPLPKGEKIPVEIIEEGGE